MLGRVAGNLVAPGIGGFIGGRLGSVAGHVFDRELEGLSYEDQETEAVYAFLEFADAAVREAAQADDDSAPPQQVASQAVATAAERHARAAARGSARRPAAPHRNRRRGHWVRHGHRIVLYGV